MKIIINADRADITDAHRHKPYLERMKESRAVDMRDNYTIEELGDGYVRRRPIDLNKRWGDED